MSKEFKIREDGFNEIKKSIIFKALPIALLTASAGITISLFAPNGDSTDLSFLFIVIPVTIGAISFGLYNAFKRQRELWRSYKLTIKDKEVIREQYNTPTISIPFSEIKSIVKNSKGVVTICGNDPTNIIGIPAQINSSEQLQLLLSEIHPILESDKKPLWEKYSVVPILLVIGAMATVYISKNKLMVSITGTILILFLGYSIYKVRRNKNLDAKTKSEMWGSIMVILSTLGIMYFKLSGKI